MLDKFFQINALQFIIFLEYKNSFHFVLPLFFLLMNALVYIDIDQGIHYGKNKVARNEKRKKQLWVFKYIKYAKFWSVSLEHFIKHKPLISEEWCIYTSVSNVPKKDTKNEIIVEPKPVFVLAIICFIVIKIRFLIFRIPWNYYITKRSIWNLLQIIYWFWM